MSEHGRIWTTAETARYLGKSVSWLRRHRFRLERSGFPKVDPCLGGRDSFAVKQFVDSRSGLLDAPKSQSDILLQRAKEIARG